MMHSLSGYHMFQMAPFTGFAFLGIVGLIVGGAVLLALLALKGYALWVAAKRDEKGWFIAMLIINTAGILELVYLIAIAKKWPKTKIHDGPKAN